MASRSAVRLHTHTHTCAQATVSGGARKDASGFKKRSEIDRRLDGLVGPSGRMKDASKLNIIKVCVQVCVCVWGAFVLLFVCVKCGCMLWD